MGQEERIRNTNPRHSDARRLGEPTSEQKAQASSRDASSADPEKGADETAPNEKREQPSETPDIQHPSLDTSVPFRSLRQRRFLPRAQPGMRRSDWESLGRKAGADADLATISEGYESLRDIYDLHAGNVQLLALEKQDRKIFRDVEQLLLFETKRFIRDALFSVHRELLWMRKPDGESYGDFADSLDGQLSRLRHRDLESSGGMFFPHEGSLRVIQKRIDRAPAKVPPGTKVIPGVPLEDIVWAGMVELRNLQGLPLIFFHNHLKVALNNGPLDFGEGIHGRTDFGVTDYSKLQPFSKGAAAIMIHGTFRPYIPSPTEDKQLQGAGASGDDLVEPGEKAASALKRFEQDWGLLFTKEAFLEDVNFLRQQDAFNALRDEGTPRASFIESVAITNHAERYDLTDLNSLFYSKVKVLNVDEKAENPSVLLKVSSPEGVSRIRITLLSERGEPEVSYE